MVNENPNNENKSVMDVGENIYIRKHKTKCGERLIVETPKNFTKFDALELQSLTWQDNLINSIPVDGDNQSLTDNVVGGEHQSHFDETIKIANEFANVEITKIYLKNRERLLITSPELSYKICLTEMGIKAIAKLDSRIFSTFLETPFGPEDDH